jgi:cytidylate kinase
MYRAVTWVVLERGLDPADARVCEQVAAQLRLDVLGPGRISADGRDISTEIRGPDVTAIVSTVSAHPAVRRHLVERQRAFVGEGPAVVEGRDIGTVVFPDAVLKVYLTASEEERSRRRAAEAGGPAGADLVRRDRVDSLRSESPLARADDAVVIDTTGLDMSDVVSRIVTLARERARVGL